MQVDSNHLESLELMNLISSNKHTVVKLMEPSLAIVRLKYIQIPNDEVLWVLQRLLGNIDQSLKKNKSKVDQEGVSFGITARKNKKYLFVRDLFIEAETLDKKLLFKNQKLNGANYYDFLRPLPFRLLDLFIQSVQINSLIINQSNLFVFPNDLEINRISFIGYELLFFAQDITAKQFRSIYNFLHSTIFEKKPWKRIGHQQKIKNFAALLLTFIIQRPIGILQNEKLPQRVNFNEAVRLVKKSPELYKKFLGITHIKKIVSEHQKIWNINLHLLFDELLVQEKNLSWSEIYRTFYRQGNIDKQAEDMLTTAVNDCWSRLSLPERRYVCEIGFVSAKESEPEIDVHSSAVLLTNALKVKLSALKNGSIFEQLSDKRQFDLVTMQLMTGLISMLDFRESMKETKQVHLPSLHQRVFRLVESAPVQREEINLYSVRTTKPEGQAEQQVDLQFKLGGLAQGSERHIGPPPVVGESKLDHALSYFKEKMANAVEAQGKSLRIEHQRLKGLKEFQNAFR